LSDPAPTARITVVPAESRAERAAFVDLPYRLYSDSDFWVPMLRRDALALIDEKKNPFFEHGLMQPFVARRGGETVGRIAAIQNGAHLETFGDDVGFFGFFECVEDYAVASALLDAAAAWLSGMGLRAMRGPANPSLHDTAGLLVDGFDFQPSVMMPYNPPYYEGFLRRWGMETQTEMLSYYVHAKYMDASKLFRGDDLVRRRLPGLTVRGLDPTRFEADVAAAMRIYNDGWQHNEGFVAMTDAEARHLASELKPILVPELFLFAERGGEPVGFSVSLPDFNQALRHVRGGRLTPGNLVGLLARAKMGTITDLRMPLMGARKDHQGKGLDAVLIAETIRRGRRMGYDGCELSWVLADNKRLRLALERMGAVVDKRYVLLEAPLA
jgi:GNAT superfamily N-acetyltransferase